MILMYKMQIKPACGIKIEEQDKLKRLKNVVILMTAISATIIVNLL